jgi:hypothetical protein
MGGAAEEEREGAEEEREGAEERERGRRRRVMREGGSRRGQEQQDDRKN